MSDTKPSLQLGKIILKNFKTYKGNVVIELSRDPNKTITIIHGEMGRGKTTLLGAIYWCLYGENSSKAESDEGILNTNVLQNLKINDYDETSVEINLYEEGELRYKIRRVMEFSKKSESTELAQYDSIGGRISKGIDLKEDVLFSSRLPSNDEWEPINDPDRVKFAINKIFPKSLSQYFLFDAELLDNFFDSSDERNVKVKDGIERISGLPIVVNSINHLKKTSDWIIKNINDVDLEPIKNEKILLERKTEKLADEINREEKNIVRFRKDIDALDTFLRTHNEENITRTQKELDELNHDIKSNRDRLKEHNKDMSTWLLRNNILIRLKNSMKKSLAKCDKWEKEGRIPIAVSGLALKNILKGNPPLCICGAHLDDGSREREHIEALLDKNLVESPIIQNITLGRGRWDALVDETHESHIKLKKYKSERDELRTADSVKLEKKKSLEKEFENTSMEDIQQKFRRRKDLQNEMYNSIENVSKAKYSSERESRKLELKDRELKIQMKKDTKRRSQTNRVDLANTIEKLFKKYRDELIDELRSAVSQKTTEYFLKLVSRENDFEHVEIKNDYRTNVLDVNKKTKSLSAGQSCCLALSFIAAIRDITEKNYFMIIDSPLLKISQIERIEIAERLPKFLPQTQITLLVQDQEYTGRARKGITGKEIPSVRDTLLRNNSLWREYELKIISEQNVQSYTKVETKH